MAEIKECSCGAVYEKTIEQLTVRDKDEFRCVLCGEILNSWKTTAMPSYRLIRTPDGKSD